MPSPVALLLPPSEGKRTGGAGGWVPASGAFADLAAGRAAVAAALQTAMADETVATRVTGVIGALGSRARAANATTVGAPALPAWQRYDGVVWEHLAPPTLSRRARLRAADVVVVSALGGLWGWDDPVPDYKCKLAARLAPLGGLAGFWRPQATAALAGRVAGGTVWDLLPGEHRRAVDLAVLPARRVIRVELVTETGAAAGHDAKAVKGAFARHLLETGAGWGRTPVGPAVAAFAWGGWQASMQRGTAVVRRA